ncbi:MAG: hypothetical protein WC460_05525 [Patescibacteria group bacterium]
MSINKAKISIKMAIISTNYHSEVKKLIKFLTFLELYDKFNAIAHEARNSDFSLLWDL